MGLKKIKEIKNIDAFDSFSWDGEACGKYNLIYGWNGSGKTTVSRVLNFLERRTIHIPELRAIEFTVETDGGLIKQTDIASHTQAIRVFNEDFISENLTFDSSKAKKIIIVGKDNVDAQKQLTVLEGEFKEKQSIFSGLEEQAQKVAKFDAILKEAGSEVPKQFGNTPLANDQYYGRSYNRSKVEARINAGTVTESNLSSLIISDPADLDVRRALLKNEKTSIGLDLQSVQDFLGLFQCANDLVDVFVKGDEESELATDKDLRDWTEAGYRLHKDRRLSSCKFCGGSLPEGHLERLGKFFTDELQKIKEQIDATILQLSLCYNGGAADLDSNVFFPDLVQDYMTFSAVIKSESRVISQSIQALIANLQMKKECLHDSSARIARIDYPGSSVDSVNGALEKIQAIVAQQNRRVSVIGEEIRKAAEGIELHTIASTLLSKEYFKKKAEAEEVAAKVAVASNECSVLTERINSLKATLHNALDALIKINQVLKDFFGENHILLEIVELPEGGVGYSLKRRGRDAKYLSEGEKSILALVYFLIKLEEDGFEKRNAIVIIDDPVDSQDGNSLFRTYGLLKRQLKDVHQLIVLTHNFEFFNLTRDWMCGPDLGHASRMYIMNRRGVDVGQKVSVEDLPALLRDHKTEYHFLCCKLFQYVNGTNLIDEPLVANIGRKVLEHFATFKWSCKSTEEFSNIVLSRFIDDQDRLRRGTGDFIIKFLHEYSHGRDFSRGIVAPILEAKDIAKNVLEFIRFTDREHYDHLKALCLPRTTA